LEDSFRIILFEILIDLKWHCSKCELKSGQAKTWQAWRQREIQLDTNEKGNFKKIFVINVQVILFIEN
jgi:hypothetical protein